MKIVKLRPAAIFTVLVAVVMGVALFIAKDFPFLARIYPLLMGSFVLVMALLLLVTEFLRKGGEKSTGGTGSGAIDLSVDTSLTGSVRARKGIIAFAWFLSAYLAIWLLGFKIGVMAFLLAYINLRGRVRWYLTLGLVACLVAILVFFDVVLEVYWPSGLLELWLGDRWPWLF